MSSPGIVVDRLWRSTAVRLAIAAFVVYNLNLRSITSFDTYPTRFLPISLLTEGDLDLDEFPFVTHVPDWYVQRFPGWSAADRQEPPYWVQRVRGHYISSYPIMPALLALPVYALPVWLGLAAGPPSRLGYSRTEIVGTLLSKITAAAFAAASVGLVFLTLLRLTRRRVALWIALLYAFATSTWAVTSQGLWQSALSQPLLALAYYLLVRGREEGRFAVWAGVPLALSVTCRPPIAIIAVALAAYVLHTHPRRFLRFALFPALMAALMLAYNYHFFGNWTGAYAPRRAFESSLFTPNPAAGLAGLLASPNRGMLVFSPWLVFAWAGLFLSVRAPRDRLRIYLAVATVAFVLFYSTFIHWPGAFGFSYRFLVDLLPGLCLGLPRVGDWLAARRWRVAVLVLAAAFSVLVQVVGTFYYPCGYPRQRVWDWRHPELLQCLKQGPRNPEGLRFLRELLGGR